MSAARPRPLTATNPDDLEAKIRERVLRLLTAQPRTRAELERSLGRAGAPDDVVARVLDRFSELKLVDDEAYAQAYVRTGLAVRRRGSRSLTMELRGRGVAPEVIAEATAEFDPNSEYATARDLAEKRLRGLARLDPPVQRRRLMGLLLRRGFSSAVALGVVNDVLSNGHESDPDEAEPHDGSGLHDTEW
jgi:regulatory protein